MPMKLDHVHQGDCLKLFSKLDDGSVDLAFADPPFNIGYDYDVYDDRKSCDEYLDWSKRWISEIVRVLKPDGTFWLAIGDEYAAELKVLCTRDLGLHCRNWVVWFYTFGVHCKGKFTRSHAHLFYFVKNRKAFTFNADAIRVPSARQLVYGDRRANPKGRVPDDTWLFPPSLLFGNPAGIDRSGGDELETVALANGKSKRGRIAHRTNASRGDADPQRVPGVGAPQHDGFILRPQDIPGAFAADSDTWYFPRVCGTFHEREGFHGCQMPEQLLGRIVRACSDEGDLVLDPFTGSGTTLSAAKKLGRRYVGFELSKDYVKRVRERLDMIRPGQPLVGSENPHTSAPKTAEGVMRTADGKRVRASKSA